LAFEVKNMKAEDELSVTEELFLPTLKISEKCRIFTLKETSGLISSSAGAQMIQKFLKIVMTLR
jgi:hypothetical protein